FDWNVRVMRCHCPSFSVEVPVRRVVGPFALTSTRACPPSICMVMPLTEPDASLLPTRPTKPSVCVVLSQNDQVPVLLSRLAASGTFTKVPLLPSKLKALPVLPDAKVTLPFSVPGLLSATSAALPSPDHQLPSPAGVTESVTVSLPPFGDCTVTRIAKFPSSRYWWLVLNVKTPAASESVVLAEPSPQLTISWCVCPAIGSVKA